MSGHITPLPSPLPEGEESEFFIKIDSLRPN